MSKILNKMLNKIIKMSASQDKSASDGLEPAFFSKDSAALYSLPTSSFAKIRAAVRNKPLIPFDQLDTIPLVPGTRSRAKLEGLVNDGWELAGHRLSSLRPPLPWDSLGRSFSFHLHALDPVSTLLAGFDVYKDDRCLSLASEITVSWLEEHQAPMISGDLVADIDRCLRAQGTMAWYDMSVGQRIYRLAYLADVLARNAEFPDEKFSLLMRSIVLHQEILSRDSFFTSHNNHGFYQALGQLAAARRFRYLPGFSSYTDLATVRVEKMLRDQFFESGVHVEHSPAYHQMILGSVSGALRCGLIEDPKLAETIARAEKALLWMRSPDGSLATFGDTDYQPKTVSEATLPSGIVAYPDAGYVFARQPGDLGMDDASYFAQMAGFHSRTHKHADHGTFVWAEKGRNILIDPGRYAYAGKTILGDELSNQGFFYSDPRRMYVEKTRSHNCVEIDGLDYQRKKAKAFGPALPFASEQQGLWTTLCEFRHKKVRHFRILIVKPRCFLVAVDWLRDGEGHQHDFRQWFQMDAAWLPSVQAETFKACHGEDPDLRLCAASVWAASHPEIHIGQSEPEMSGWMSDGPNSLVPSPSINWRADQTSLAKFATIFNLGDELTVDRGRSFVNDSITRGELHWSDARRQHVLAFSRETSDNSLTVRLTDS